MSKTRFLKAKKLWSKEKNQLQILIIISSNKVRLTEKQKNVIKSKKKINNVNLFHTINSTGETSSHIIINTLYYHHF